MPPSNHRFLAGFPPGGIPALAPSIRGVLITLKLTDLLQVADKSQWFAVLAALGFKTLRLQQLSVHHKKFVLLEMG